MVRDLTRRARSAIRNGGLDVFNCCAAVNATGTWLSFRLAASFCSGQKASSL